MLQWKTAAKHYREVASHFMQLFQREQTLRRFEEDVVRAARTYTLQAIAPKNPYVKLVTGQDINVQKAQQNLIEAVQELEKFIQVYSQNPEENSPPENLDNASLV